MEKKNARSETAREQILHDPCLYNKVAKLYTRAAQLIKANFDNKLPLPTIIIGGEDGLYSLQNQPDNLSLPLNIIIFPACFDFSNRQIIDDFIIKHLFKLYFSMIQNLQIKNL